jgi:hypothetical protein
LFENGLTIYLGLVLGLVILYLSKKKEKPGRKTKKTKPINSAVKSNVV